MSLKAGSIEPLQFWVYEADGETPVSGLEFGAMEFPAWLNDEPVALVFSDFNAFDDGAYFVNMTVPNDVGSALTIKPAVIGDPTRRFDPGVWDDKIMANDIDSVAILAARPPSVTLASNISPRSAFSISVYKEDGLNLTIPIYDANGDLIDLTEWENFRFSIQNTAQTVVGGNLPYHQTDGITGGADGMLSVELPEDCSAYNTHPAGHSDTKHWWSVDANPIGDATKTRTLRAGPFVIKSKETASPESP